ncbi:uncharacterized protein LOC126668769 [Mercurialis annua]|uniref:uncharacterized protein LOC126668769 n=1 Tax=Mercurialis annua TaxID=3986 RepID=UPI002160383E|nr:uncharacterized protein LOC126668769 [Mercurialis annua]
MGSCFTKSELIVAAPTAKVVSINGTLRQYSVPVFAYQVLEAEAASNSSSSGSTSFFLCNSDLLSYDDFIPPLDSDAQLSKDQLYFVLPKSKLQNRLTASDMAGLAVKASLALQKASSKDGRRKKARISPVFLLSQSPSESVARTGVTKTNILGRTPPPLGYSRSRSVRKLQKYASRRAKLAVRSFRLGLSTIYEGTAVV